MPRQEEKTNYKEYCNAYFAEPRPEPPCRFSGAFGVTIPHFCFALAAKLFPRLQRTEPPSDKLTSEKKDGRKSSPATE
jgi:hypothetical protein